MLDAAVFLLLVSAAVATLSLPVGTGPDPPTARADGTAEALATGTTSVRYRLSVANESSPRPHQPSPPGNGTVAVDGAVGPGEAVRFRVVEREGDGPVVRGGVTAERAVGRALRRGAGTPAATSGERLRVAHGSYAGLLAEAAVENATLDGRALSNASDGFERRVAVAVLEGLNATGSGVQVRAVWTPYRGAPVRGVASAGWQPPPDAAVAASVVRVPSRFASSGRRARRAAATDGYAGVARVVARATVRGWFPPGDARLALRGDHPVDTLLARRYRRTAAALDTNVTRPVAAVEPRVANRRLAAALAADLERDLRERFDSPRGAARAVRVGEVRVVVRAW